VGSRHITYFTEAARREGIAGVTEAVLAPELVFRDVDDQQAEQPHQCFADMSNNAGAETLLGFFNSMSRDDDRPLLANIATPTLLMTSTNGQEVPVEVGLYLRQRIQNAQLVELPGTDHFAFATRPQLVNLLIEQLLHQAVTARHSPGCGYLPVKALTPITSAAVPP
jgi:non-heme chloroperoxidase